MSKPTTRPSAKGLLERLHEGIVLGAEGYIFELERRGFVKAGAYVPEVLIDYPSAVRELHREFLRAGSDVMVALTYYAHREKLRVIGREAELETMNRTAVRLANEVAREGGALVAGNICNTWAYDTSRKVASSKEVRKQYTEQLTWAVEEGIDFVLAETLEYVGEALIALEVIKSFNLPAVINFSAIYDKSKDGYNWITACKILKDHGADVVGFNCARGPETLLPLVCRLREAVAGPIAAVPVPYHTNEQAPSFQFLKNLDGTNGYTLGLDQHLLSRLETAAFASEAAEIGVNYLGLCCGAGAHHIRAMAEALGRTPTASKYSPDMSQHGLLGGDAVVKKSEKRFLKQWK
ncbi:MAG TPA: homocysteine S-methyltransferase family protein [Candidatus Saccharimonadales bacterium]|jgi:betaine-homocysteine S-methyltransferase|nr:homocysteine S-methyltransferase family protein [Candidatus Saccharimonadales bacterium]